MLANRWKCKRRCIDAAVGQIGVGRGSDHGRETSTFAGRHIHDSLVFLMYVQEHREQFGQQLCDLFYKMTF